MNMLLPILSLFSLLILPVSAKPLSNFEILKIVDGDTVKIIYPGLPPNLNKLSVRVYGIDTPEKGWRAECESERQLAIKASKLTQDKISNAHAVYFDIMKWGKFGGRFIGRISIDGQDLGDMLIEKGYARPYFGDKKKSWCN